MGYVEELRALIGHKCIILPGSAVIVENKDGLILMQQRKYPYGKWSLPGGLMELSESTIETAKRELLEETGLIIGELKLLGVYSGKDYLCTAANGDEWYVVTTVYMTKEFQGAPSVNDGESIAFKWVDPNCIPDGTVKTHRYMIRDYLKSQK
ncbi:MAG: NUDIX hydrolase [Oscillospiraceae bacterium]|nr:NUDIX hydrolase [Oscillospiraceae bacterium]